jgi:hypothetical protein
MAHHDKELPVESFLKDPIKVPFDALYLDPNNPRLARENQPGYEDPKPLVDPALQLELETVVRKEHDVEGLITAIETQGWMPIDAIVVWKFPDNGAKYIVMEGNRRTVALRDLRQTVLPREVKKLESMRRRRGIAKRDVEDQEDRVKQLERVIADTKKLTVVPLDAANVEELKAKLPRVLAVRHIQGARTWGNYAEDLWLLERYSRLYEEKHPGEDLGWETALIARVAHEASLGEVKAKRQLQAASAFSHFKAEWEDHLPDGESFGPQDYYLFENIVKKPWLRDQFGMSLEGLHLEREEVLFGWFFAKSRGRTAEENQNVFYRHENVLVWEKIHRYDVDNKTDFASRFDVDEPDSAPKFAEVEAAWLMHKARRAPSEVLEHLLGQIGSITQDTLVTQADFLRPMLEKAIARCQQCVAMIDAAQDAPTIAAVDGLDGSSGSKVSGRRRT